MRASLQLPSFAAVAMRATLVRTAGIVICASFGFTTAQCQTQSHAGLLSTRAELLSAASAADIAAAKGDAATRTQNAMLAAAIRTRLREGDLQVGDRIVVSYISDVMHRDTVVVHAGRSLELSGMIPVPLAGVLRSELQDRVSAELLKYVKAQNIEVTPLMRVAVLGAVARPGYFAFPSDIPLADAIMGAGGPTGAAAFDRSTVRRRNEEYRSAVETSKAIAGGLTLDQFGLSAGDELVIGQRSEFDIGRVIGLTGAAASVVAVIIAIGRRH